MIKDRIKELREKNGLTISAFAKSLGISPTSASLYESGKQNPGKKTIAKICEVYGVDEGYLLSTPGDKATPIDKATPTTKATSTAKEDDKAVEEKKRGRRPKKTDVVNEEKELDITAILARVAEVGVRKAAAEAGVAWQTVNKWKKDAEKAALSSSDDIQKTLDNLTTPEGAQEAVAAPDEGMKEKKEPDITAILARVAEIGVRKAAAEAGVAWQTVNKWKKDAEKAALSSSEEIQKAVDNMATPEGTQEAVTAPDEEKKETNDQIDISAVLARVAEIGVRKAAAEAGVAWQTVNKWKKDAEKAATPAASTKEEKKEEKKPEENKTTIIIQSPLGGAITSEQILSKIPAGSDSVYVRVDENKLYWVKGSESGAVDIWG